MRHRCRQALLPLGGYLLATGSVACAHGTMREQSRAPDATITGAVDSIVEAGRREFHFPGISLVILRGHDVVLSRGYGMADLASGTPATDSTVYQVGSLSKEITAAAVMTLVEAGRVRLDDPVSRYLPELPVARDSALRLRTLLAQTSGLRTWDD